MIKGQLQKELRTCLQLLQLFYHRLTWLWNTSQLHQFTETPAVYHRALSQCSGGVYIFSSPVQPPIRQCADNIHRDIQSIHLPLGIHSPGQSQSKIVQLVLTVLGNNIQFHTYIHRTRCCFISALATARLCCKGGNFPFHMCLIPTDAKYCAKFWSNVFNRWAGRLSVLGKPWPLQISDAGEQCVWNTQEGGQQPPWTLQPKLPALHHVPEHGEKSWGLEWQHDPAGGEGEDLEPQPSSLPHARLVSGHVWTLSRYCLQLYTFSSAFMFSVDREEGEGVGTTEHIRRELLS